MLTFTMYVIAVYLAYYTVLVLTMARKGGTMGSNDDSETVMVVPRETMEPQRLKRTEPSTESQEAIKKKTK